MFIGRKKLLFSIFAVCVFIFSTVGFACSQPAPAPAPTPSPAPAPAPKPEPVVLTAISYMPADTDQALWMKNYADRINEKSNGALTIEYRGGPEVVPGENQAEAVKTGVIDISEHDMGELVAASSLFDLSKLSLEEEKASGFDAFMKDQYAKEGFYYLWRVPMGDGFYIYTTFNFSKPEDFKGKKMRTAPPYVPIYECLDVAGVKVPLPDTYSALERGLVEGRMGKHSSTIRSSLYEVQKYWLDLPFFEGGGEAIIMNLDSWNKLPKDLQDMMTSVAEELNPEAIAYFAEKRKGYDKTLMDNGMEPVTFSKEDADRLIECSYGNQWAEIEEDLGPEVAKQARDLLSK